MEKRYMGLTTVFLLLLVVTAAGILGHWVSGYDYPASPAMTFEVNVLADPYELFLVVPAGLIGLWMLRRGSRWGSLIIAGVAAHFVYNYAMSVTGAQNLWIFVWVLKLALSGAAACLLWRHLPAGPGRPGKAGKAVSAYLALILLVFSKLMGERLLASATGRTMDMTMQAAGTLDWGEPFLRDPIIFFALACPVFVAAILGLWKGTEWGGRAASFSSAFIVSMVTVILFTGPIKEILRTGSVSPAMLGMSVVMGLTAVPAVFTMAWLARRRPGEPKTQPLA